MPFANSISSSMEFQIHQVSLLVILSIATLVPNPVFSSNECAFPAIFNFGDSNSDTGGLAASILAPKPPYGDTYFHRPVGRFSDGRLIIDFMGTHNLVFHLYFNLHHV